MISAARRERVSPNRIERFDSQRLARVSGTPSAVKEKTMIRVSIRTRRRARCVSERRRVRDAREKPFGKNRASDTLQLYANSAAAAAAMPAPTAVAETQAALSDCGVQSPSSHWRVSKV